MAVVCDRCDNRVNGPMPTDITVTVRKVSPPLILKTIDLCRHCRTQLRVMINSFIEPLPKIVQQGHSSHGGSGCP